MEAKFVEKQEEEFKPITIQLTFETQQEINAMYIVVNRSSSFLWGEAEKGCVNSSKLNSSLKEWRIISEKIYELLKSKI